MSTEKIYDVIVIGGGAVGLSAAYETAKADKLTLLLEKSNFYNSSGSSGDLARMFRTMYTEKYMAELAHKCMRLWDELEEDAGDNSLRLMSGLLNFGNPEYGAGGPEGTLKGPIENLIALKMSYKELTRDEIQDTYPFKNLPDTYEGIFAPDNGVINVPLLLRTLYRLAQSYGAALRADSTVNKIVPINSGNRHTWKVLVTRDDGSSHEYIGEKIIIACGAYTNHVLTPSFDFHLKLDIWEMVASYFGSNPGPKGTVFPSMWFQFEDDDKTHPGTQESRLFYGFPTLPWGPPNLARIAVDAATRRIPDPVLRSSSVISPEDIEVTRQFINERVKGVDVGAPASSFTCLQTNVYDNMFVLDFIPPKYLPETHKDSIAVFTAGWAMKFIPLLGRALGEMVVNGSSEYALEEFKMDRHGDSPEKVIIVDGPSPIYNRQETATHEVISQRAGKGSSMRYA